MPRDNEPILISLAKAATASAAVLPRGAYTPSHDGASPTLRELTESLHFALGDGRIWLNDQRMVLMQTKVLGRLRQEIIDAFGIETARGIFMRVGYMQGVRDAQLIQKRFPNEDLTRALAAGPRVHTLEGFAKVETKRFEYDSRKGTYFGEFYWRDSSEAAEHVAHHGLASEPVCWMQTGYPSGYTSTLFGRPVIFRELECSGMGAERCYIVGQNAQEWGQDAPEIGILGLDWPSRGRTKPSPPAERPPPADALSVARRAAGKVTGEETAQEAVVGVSASFQRAMSMVEKVAGTDATVLLTGQSGVGKEMFSRQLHRFSRRSTAPLVTINCAAIPAELVETELFGAEKGAYTGAVASRAGYFERASGGTLFLDEISSLAYPAQAKLLRAIQERVIERVGGNGPIAADVRIIAASNVDLAEEVQAGRFRQDLYYRLCVFPIHIPPLKERRDDIPLLVDYFLRSFCARHRRRVVGLTRRAMDMLLAYDFPGNIRELQNLIERGVVLADDGGLIDIHHLFTAGEALKLRYSPRPDGRLQTDQTTAPASLQSAQDLVAAEVALYRAALQAEDGNISKAARRLGLTRAKLEYRLRKHGIAP